MAEVRWERMTAPELRAFAARDAVVVLPVASLEQHGPHLPVWTDSFIGHAVAVAGAERCGEGQAVVLPPMWLGLSEHHFPFGGTISLDYAAFAAVLRCVTRSILADGFRRLFLLNSHGGNIEPLAVAARELAHEFAIPVVTTTITKLAPAAIAAALTTQPGMQHACEAETSLWLHLDPGQVRADQVAHSVSPGGFASGDGRGPCRHADGQGYLAGAGPGLETGSRGRLISAAARSARSGSPGGRRGRSCRRAGRGPSHAGARGRRSCRIGVPAA
jgi:creatinine amidohydrolase